MYSPCQNGILAGVPGAGVTTTRSCSIAAIRHVDEPSWKTSPILDSCTNSSSSSPSRVRSGRLTVYNPRSGIVPPDITAVIRAARLPISRSLTRSQVMRGSSSAATSDGYLPDSIPRTSSNADRDS